MCSLALTWDLIWSSGIQASKDFILESTTEVHEHNSSIK